jgi:DNA-binding transcriptional regulator PaaX
VIEIIYSFFFFVFSKKENPSSQQIKAFLEKNRGISISEKLVRYHLNRLCALGFVVHEKGFYSLNPAPDAERDDLAAAFRHWYRMELEESVSMMEKALGKVQAAYEK